jgi:hypothetical protein
MSWRSGRGPKRFKQALLFLKKKQQKNFGPGGFGNAGQKDPGPATVVAVFKKSSASFLKEAFHD